MKIIRLLRRCHLPFLLLLSTQQAALLVLCRYAPQAAVRLALFPVFSLLMLMGCTAVPGRLRPAAMGACLFLLAGAGFLLLPHTPVLYAMPACSAALLFCALPHAERSASGASPLLYVASIAAQLWARFLWHHADDAVRSALLLPMEGALLVWLLLLLLAFNRISLNNATLSRYRLSAGMSRAGTALTMLVFLFAVLLSAAPAVVSGVTWLFAALRDAAIWFVLFLLNLFPAQSTGGSAGPAMTMAPAAGTLENAPPSLLAVVMEQIATLLAIAVLIAGSAVLLRLLAKRLFRLVRRLLLHLQRYAAAVTEDYEDEITDTRGDGGERSFQLLRRRAKPGLSYPDTPAGRIRRRYAQLFARHAAWPDSSTARENLQPDAASIYERARYSGHAVTEEDAARFERDA